MPWISWEIGAANDDKFLLIGQELGEHHLFLAGVWAALLERGYGHSGKIEASDEELALLFRVDRERLGNILSAFRERKLLSGRRIKNWKKYQHASASSTERTRRFRHKQAKLREEAERSGNVSATPEERFGNAYKTRQDKTRQDKTNTEDNAPPPADAAPVEKASQPKPKSPPSAPKELTPQQAIILEAWEAHDLGPMPKSPRGYSGLVALVQSKGIPLVREWIAYVRRQQPSPPEGAEAWKWFCDSFRAGLNRPWEWNGKRGEARAGRGLPGQPEDYAGGRVDDW